MSQTEQTRLARIRTFRQTKLMPPAPSILASFARINFMHLAGAADTGPSSGQSLVGCIPASQCPAFSRFQVIGQTFTTIAPYLVSIFVDIDMSPRTGNIMSGPRVACMPALRPPRLKEAYFLSLQTHVYGTSPPHPRSQPHRFRQSCSSSRLFGDSSKDN